MEPPVIEFSRSGFGLPAHSRGGGNRQRRGVRPPAGGGEVASVAVALAALEARTVRPSGLVGRLEVSGALRRPGQVQSATSAAKQVGWSGPGADAVHPAAAAFASPWSGAPCSRRVLASAGHVLRPRSLAKSQSPETHLETRTKECKRRVSHRVMSAVRPPPGGRRLAKPGIRVKAKRE